MVGTLQYVFTPIDYQIRCMTTIFKLARGINIVLPVFKSLRFTVDFSMNLQKIHIILKNTQDNLVFNF